MIITVRGSENVKETRLSLKVPDTLLKAGFRLKELEADNVNTLSKISSIV